MRGMWGDIFLPSKRNGWTPLSWKSIRHARKCHSKPSLIGSHVPARSRTFSSSIIAPDLRGGSTLAIVKVRVSDSGLVWSARSRASFGAIHQNARLFVRGGEAREEAVARAIFPLHISAAAIHCPPLVSLIDVFRGPHFTMTSSLFDSSLYRSFEEVL